MKIFLERKIESCPKMITCLICARTFTVGKIRALLASNRGLIQGDICPHCLQLNSKEIKHKLREKALFLLIQSPNINLQKISIHQQSLELLTLSKERIRFPNFLDWLFIKIAIFFEEYQEMETSKLGLTQCIYQQRSQLEKLFEKEI